MPSALLLSGGLDSAVLLAEEAAKGDVQPVYVAAGLAWERAERDFVAALLASLKATRGRIAPLDHPYYSGGLRFTLWVTAADGSER